MTTASFGLGMIASTAAKSTTMKAERDQAHQNAGRDLVALKSAIVDAELDQLDLKLRSVRRPTRRVSSNAYDADGAVGASLVIHPET